MGQDDQPDRFHQVHRHFGPLRCLHELMETADQMAGRPAVPGVDKRWNFGVSRHWRGFTIGQVIPVFAKVVPEGAADYHVKVNFIPQRSRRTSRERKVRRIAILRHLLILENQG